MTLKIIFTHIFRNMSDFINRIMSFWFFSLVDRAFMYNREEELELCVDENPREYRDVCETFFEFCTALESGNLLLVELIMGESKVYKVLKKRKD